MAYDETLADRVREVLADEPGSDEKKMFGGLCFLLNGNMCCGVMADELMIRVGPDGYEDALAQPSSREMDFTGRAMKGMVYVDAGGLAEDSELESWVGRGIDFAGNLPPK